MTFDASQVYDFGLEKTKDMKILMQQFGTEPERGRKHQIEVNVTNTDRAFGTIFGLRSRETIRKDWRRIRIRSNAAAQVGRASELLSRPG